MRILILDDEKKSREVLKALIELYCEGVEQIETCQDISSAKLLIAEFKPDLAFMDISLREGDSYQLLNEMGEFDFEIIFITAFDENSVRVLNYCHIPTLMKPIDIEQLEKEMSKVQDRLHSGYSMRHYQLARHLFKKPVQILPIFTQNRWELIQVPEIEAMESEPGKTILKMKNAPDIHTPVVLSVIEKIIE